MKRMITLIALAALFIFSAATWTKAADVPATSSTQPVLAAGEGGGIGTQLFNPERIGKAFMSFEQTAWFEGWFNYKLNLPSKPAPVNVSGQMKAMFYWENNEVKFKFYQFNISYDGGPTVEYVGPPFEKFPYPVKGVPSNLSVYLNGYDDNGYCTKYCQYNSMTWKAGDVFMYYAKPGYLPITIEFDLAGQPASRYGLALDSFGGTPIPYTTSDGGFTVWLDPLQTYSGRIVDRWYGNATVVTVPSFEWGTAIPRPIPDGSYSAFQFAGGIHPIHFGPTSTFEPGDCYYDNIIPTTASAYTSAILYLAEPQEIMYQELDINLWNFAGRLRVVIADSQGAISTFKDIVWSTPAESLHITIPAGMARSVMITVIKEDIPVTVPVWFTWWEPWRFNMNVIRVTPTYGMG